MAHLVERRLQQVAVVLQRLRRIVEQAQGRLAAGVAAAQQQRQHEARGRGADGAGQQMLGEAQQVDVGLRVGRDGRIAAGGVFGERALGPLGAQVARNGVLQVAGRHRRAPAPERGRHGRPGEGLGHEDLRLQALDRLGSPQHRHRHEHRHVDGHAPQHAVAEGVDLHVEQGPRRQEVEAERPVDQDRARGPAGLDDPGQQKRVGPHGEAADDAADGAARGGVAPHQAAEEGRRELRHRRERHEPDGGQAMRMAQQAIEQIAQQDDGEDGDAADGEQQPRHVLLLALGLVAAAAQQQRQHQAVRDHDGQRHRIDDHHGGGGRQSADERQQRDGIGPGRQRQRQHEAVGIEGALGQAQQARRGDGNHEQVDQHQVDREQPGGAADLRLRVVLHHRHVELARQQQDGHQAEERHRQPGHAVKVAGEDAMDLRVLLDALEKIADAAQHGERDEEADRQEGGELDERFGRNRDDQAFLMLGRIDVARAEQNGEGRHRQGDDEGRVGRQIEMLQRARAEQRVDRQRHRLQLQGDVGQRAGDGDDRDDGGDRLALAVAGGEEVGDRGDVLALGQPHDAQQEAPAEHEQQDRAQIDGDEIVAGGGGIADAAEERPGGAVDRQRQGIDERSAAARLAEAAGPVGIPRQREQDTHVSQRQRHNAPAFDHGPSIMRDRASVGGHRRPRGIGRRRPAHRRASPRGFAIVLEAGLPVQRGVVNSLSDQALPPFCGAQQCAVRAPIAGPRRLPRLAGAIRGSSGTSAL